MRSYDLQEASRMKDITAYNKILQTQTMQTDNTADESSRMPSLSNNETQDLEEEKKSEHVIKKFDRMMIDTTSAAAKWLPFFH